MGRYQHGVPVLRHIGIAEKHRRGSVGKSYRQAVHRPLILAEKHFASVPSSRTTTHFHSFTVEPAE
ncbi:MAG: hypothetical protein P0119_16845 [Nitrospira sp.]|nr:hypothetical protein [Nitrospira sp.]